MDWLLKLMSMPSSDMAHVGGGRYEKMQPIPQPAPGQGAVIQQDMGGARPELMPRAVPHMGPGMPSMPVAPQLPLQNMQWRNDPAADQSEALRGLIGQLILGQNGRR